MAAEGRAVDEVPSVVSATATADEVAVWLRTYKDGKWAELANAALKDVDGEDLHGYTEAQLRDFCGGLRGAALYNVLHRESRAAAASAPRRAAPRPRRLRASGARAPPAACAIQRHSGAHAQRPVPR